MGVSMDRRNFLLNSISATILADREARSGSMRDRQGRVTVGNSRLQIELSYGPKGLEEALYRVDDRPLSSLRSVPWVVLIDGKKFSPENQAARPLSAAGASPVRSATFAGNAAGLSWELKYEVTGLGRITKTLRFAPAADGILGQASLWNGFSDQEPLVSHTKLQDIAAFYRQDDRGIFVSLDFPYSKIACERGMTKVWYPPFDAVKLDRPTLATLSPWAR